MHKITCFQLPSCVFVPIKAIYARWKQLKHQTVVAPLCYRTHSVSKLWFSTAEYPKISTAGCQLQNLQFQNCKMIFPICLMYVIDWQEQKCAWNISEICTNTNWAASREVKPIKGNIYITKYLRRKKLPRRITSNGIKYFGLTKKYTFIIATLYKSAVTFQSFLYYVSLRKQPELCSLIDLQRRLQTVTYNTNLIKDELLFTLSPGPSDYMYKQPSATLRAWVLRREPAADRPCTLQCQSISSVHLALIASGHLTNHKSLQ